MKLLLADDDHDLVAVLTVALQRAGFAVVAAHDACTARALLETEGPALVLLHMTLEGTTTLDLLQALRRARPHVVIMVTGRGTEDDRVRFLDAGADDYVLKPFSPRELVARIRAFLRHCDVDIGATPAPAGVLLVGPLVLNPATHTAARSGQPLHLTVTEFRLLHCLMVHAGAVVTLGTLLQEVWGSTDPRDSHVVRTTVYRLRRKLGDDPAEPRLLHTVPGIGFLLKAALDNGSAGAARMPALGVAGSATNL